MRNASKIPLLSFPCYRIYGQPTFSNSSFSRASALAATNSDSAHDFGDSPKVHQSPTALINTIPKQKIILPFDHPFVGKIVSADECGSGKK